jgi:hypothetical protein
MALREYSKNTGVRKTIKLFHFLPQAMQEEEVARELPPRQLGGKRQAEAELVQEAVVTEVNAPFEAVSTVVAAPVSLAAAPATIRRRWTNQDGSLRQEEKKRGSKTKKRDALSQDAAKSNRSHGVSIQDDSIDDELQLNSSDEASSNV